MQRRDISLPEIFESGGIPPVSVEHSICISNQLRQNVEIPSQSASCLSANPFPVPFHLLRIPKAAFYPLKPSPTHERRIQGRIGSKGQIQVKDTVKTEDPDAKVRHCNLEPGLDELRE